MSGIIKKVGDLAKRVIKSPIFKAVLIAAAIYFTAGIAAGAMGSTFAAGLPGITTAMETLGIAAPVAADVAGGVIPEATAMLTAAGDSVGAIESGAEAAAQGSGIVGSSIGADVTTAPLDVSAGAESVTPSIDAPASSLGIQPQQSALTYGEPPTGTPAMQNVGAVEPPAEIPAPASQADMTPQTPTDGTIGNTEGSQARSLSDAGQSIRDVNSPASGPGVKGPGNSFLDGMSKWWGGMDATTKQIIGTGLAHAGSSVVGAISANAKMAQEQGMFNTLQANKARIGPSPGQYNGIINSQFSRPAPGG